MQSGQLAWAAVSDRSRPLMAANMPNPRPMPVSFQSMRWTETAMTTSEARENKGMNMNNKAEIRKRLTVDWDLSWCM